MWIYGYMDIWIYGYVDIWIYGHMDIYIYIYKDIHGYVDIWMCGYMIYGYMDIEYIVAGRMGIATSWWDAWLCVIIVWEL